MKLLLPALLAVSLGACQTHSYSKPSAACEIADANEQIDGQRIIKRRLILADPVEHKVEEMLNHHAKIESARMAMTVSVYSSEGIDDGRPFPFHAVMVMRQAVSDAEAEKIMADAFGAAGYGSHVWPWVVAQDGNTVVVRGFVRPMARDKNPDLTKELRPAARNPFTPSPR